jgi:hypothetical protein
MIYFLMGTLCIPALAEEQASVQQPEPDVWSSIESTIETMADPFMSEIPKPVQVVPDVPAPVPVQPTEEKPPIVDLSPPPPPVIPLPQLYLSGVMYNTVVPMAVINGKVFAIGEDVETESTNGLSIKLIAVYAESIEVDFMGEKHTIPLLSNEKSNEKF